MKKILFALVLLTACAKPLTVTEGPFRLTIDLARPEAVVGREFFFTLVMGGKLPPLGSQSKIEMRLDDELLNVQEGTFAPPSRYLLWSINYTVTYWCERVGIIKEDVTGLPPIDETYSEGFPTTVRSTLSVRFFTKDPSEDKWRMEAEASRIISVACMECIPASCSRYNTV